MKLHINVVVTAMFLLLTGCDLEDSSPTTYITLINESQTTLRGLQGFIASDPTINTQNFENIEAGNEATIEFLMACSVSWQLRVRLDGFLILYHYTGYAETQMPCDQTTICTVHEDESFSCNQ
ncbi:MAG: hypothetical protein OEY11_13575 [Gammaproteobacteria bacterium]|nr:hypothetical protein [Gammaproteobacteria bacterium]